MADVLAKSAEEVQGTREAVAARIINPIELLRFGPLIQGLDEQVVGLQSDGTA